jgi:hypothetical protein
MGTLLSTRPRVAPALGAADVLPVAFEALEAAAVDGAIPEWDACASMPGNPFGLSPFFATAVWAHDLAARGDLCLVTGRDAAGRLQALLPVWVARSRLPVFGVRTLLPVAFAGQETSAVVVGEADRAQATAALAEFLLGPAMPGYDVLRFPAIDPGSLLFAALTDAAQRLGLPVSTGAPLRQALVAPGRPPGEALTRALEGARRAAAQAGVPVVCREISWDWASHLPAPPAPGVACAPGTHAEGARPAGTPASLGALLGRLDRHFRAHAFAAFAGDRLAAWLLCFREEREAVLWHPEPAERQGTQDVDVDLLLWEHTMRELAGWPGVERVGFRPLERGDDPRDRDAEYSVCELSIVRANGVRRRLAMRRR